MISSNGNIFRVTFVRGIHSPHKGLWRGALFSLICVWINGWVNNREAGDLRRYRAHYDVTVMLCPVLDELRHSIQVLLHWHLGNDIIVQMQAKKPWRTWVNVRNGITTLKIAGKSVTKVTDVTTQHNKAKWNCMHILWDIPSFRKGIIVIFPTAAHVSGVIAHRLLHNKLLGQD